ncbi:MurR/RpiR family transcriptional regulator [Pelosinus fermentans]|uniref:Transcriptional regulator, RpiR family n=1 Tax=Pelosinus fermentans JBW45 TaxID=1192197 RepID=I9DAH8_9FIRM|nr:MurR/RpiR family transcriptional regulator [Pelosinus fermentans]AJQ26328.1 transcriptional regulator, RpiR family [Pelosinus fermentans JBW45]
MNSERTFEDKIKTVYNHLSKSEKKVADYVLEHGHEVTRLPLTDLAQKSQVSEPTVVRFTKRVGFSGYSDLKLSIMKDWGKKTVIQDNNVSLLIDLHVNKDDKLEDIPGKMIHITMKALQDTLRIIDISEYLKAVKSLTEANIIDIYGVGNSGSITNDLMNKLMRIGLNARAFNDNHLQQISATHLTKDDVAIAISHSGSTKDVIDTLKIAKENGARTIALSNYKASEISKYADIQLFTGDFETTFYSETMVSRISQLAIVDMLYMGLLLSDYSKYTNRLDKINLLVEKKNY